MCKLTLLCVQGYLYSGTVDYLSPDIFIWVLLLIGYILPNIGILVSHALVIMGLRLVTIITPHLYYLSHAGELFLAWLR